MRKISLAASACVMLFAGLLMFVPSSANAAWYYVGVSGSRQSTSYASQSACDYVRNTQFGGAGTCIEETCGDMSGQSCMPGSSCGNGYTAATGSCQSGYSCCKAAPAATGGTCAAAGGTCRAGTTTSGGALSCPAGESIAVGTCTNSAMPLCCKSTTAAGGAGTGAGAGAGTGAGTACTGTCKAACDTAAGESIDSGKCDQGVCCKTAVTAGGSITPVSFTNPLKFDTVQGATAVFLNAFQGIIVMLALIFLVLGGIFYITSGGDSKKIESAKGMITAAMIGLAIGVAAPSFLKEIGNILGWGGAEVPTEVSGAKSAIEVAQAVLDFLLSIVGLLAMVMLVIGGLMFFAAAGDEKRAETAKGIVKYSVIGVAVAIVSLIIVRTIAGLF
ncbi:MAG: hypothetical protein HGA33_05270 [Candidatus Moranbacteria bacterium]|nr:hypothetical protein [Candidatus Moranbacteria bacterium]